MGLLEGKTALICGVANHRSIAWGIAQAFQREGARLIFTYQGERLLRYLEDLTKDIDNTLLYPCDVTNDEDIDNLFSSISNETDTIDTLVHSIAFAPKESLADTFISTDRESFRLTMDISAYSLVALSRGAVPFMKNGGSIMAMSYLGAEKIVPKYNVMGVAKAALESSVRYLAYDLGEQAIRVNAISAGPVNTMAARGIKGFTTMLKIHAEKAPLKRNVTLDELGNTATFLASDMSTGITGETLYVDCGGHHVGV